MATRKTLTATGVERMRGPASGQVEHWDMRIPGFGIRVTSKGRKSWVLMRRLHGKLIRVTLGQYPAMDLAEARKAAGDMADMIERGEDPRETKRQQLAEAADKQRNTVEGVVRDFIAKHAKRHTKSWRQQELAFEKHVLPKWGKRPISAITRRDVMDLLDELVDAGLSTGANRVLAYVRKMFNWAVERGIVDMSPVPPRMKPPAKEAPRERTLSDEEIADLWQACSEAGYPFGPLLKMMLVTGQRRGEVATMRWQDVDLEEGTWTIPAADYKTGVAHTVPLSRLALDLLAAAPRFAEGKRNNGFVFTTTAGEKPVSGYGKPKARLDEAIAKARKKDKREAMPAWRLHDLRRTVRTNLPALGISPDTAERVVGHAIGGVRGVYDRYSYLPEKRQALDAWARKLEWAVGLETAPENVVEFPA